MDDTSKSNLAPLFLLLLVAGVVTLGLFFFLSPGGPDAPDGLDKGYFVRPTVFSDVRNDLTIAQVEILGPVLSVSTTRTKARC